MYSTNHFQNVADHKYTYDEMEADPFLTAIYSRVVNSIIPYLI